MPGDILLSAARLGGYLDRCHDFPPGPKAIRIGWQRLRDRVWALEAQEQVASQGQARTCV
jgi:hypothetical protein